MKRKSLFRWLDLIIYFNVFVFIGAAVVGVKDNLAVGIIFFTVVLVNIVYLVISIRNRIKIVELDEKRLELELKMEEAFKEEENIDINEVKRKMLISRIESEVKNGFPNAKVIKNATIPKKDGNYNEVDLIVLDVKGIFVIKVKNITGKIKGNWDEKNLKVEHPGGETFDLINPIDLNSYNFFALKDILGLKTNYFRSVIVFGDNTYIDSYRSVPHFARLCKVEQLINSMNRLASKYNTTLEAYEIDTIYEQLLPLVNQEKDKKE